MPSHLARFYEYTATVARMPQHERAAEQFVGHRLRRPVTGGLAGRPLAGLAGHALDLGAPGAGVQ